MRWILDPIDGTVNYLYGLPQYAVSLAAEVDGVVVAGVVRNVGHRRGVDRAPRRRRSAAGAGRTGSRVRPDRAGAGAGRHRVRVRRRRRAPPGARCWPGWPPGARHPPVRRRRARPVLGRRGPGGRVLREGAEPVGPRGRRAWSRAEAGLLVTGLRGAPPGLDLVLAAPPASTATCTTCWSSWTPTADRDGQLLFLMQVPGGGERGAQRRDRLVDLGRGGQLAEPRADHDVDDVARALEVELQLVPCGPAGTRPGSPRPHRASGP